MNVFNVGPTNCVVQYKRLKTKLLILKENVKFNKECLRLNIIPRYAQITIRDGSRSAQETKKIAERTWVIREIRRMYSRTAVLNYQLYKVHLELLNTVNLCNNKFFIYYLRRYLHKSCNYTNKNFKCTRNIYCSSFAWFTKNFKINLTGELLEKFDKKNQLRKIRLFTKYS